MTGDRNINTEGGNYNENFRDYIVNVDPNNNQTRLGIAIVRLYLIS